MQPKRFLLTMSLVALCAGAAHAAEAGQAEAAKLYDCPPPVMPMAAAREDMFGDVTLQYQGNAAGRIADIKIIKSSGFRALDKAAVLALARCRLAVPAAGTEAAAPATTEYKFARQTRVTSSSQPVLIPDSCAPSERFTTYVASTYDRVEAPGASIRFLVSAAGVPYVAASYEHDKALAAAAIAFIQTCRFQPATLNGAAAVGSSDGFIRLKALQ